MKIRIKTFVLDKIQRAKKALEALDNPTASPKSKMEAVQTLFRNDPGFWSEIVRMTVPGKVHTTPLMSVALAKPSVQAIMPTKLPISATTPARTLRVPKPTLAPAGTSEFGKKMNGAAMKLGLGDYSPLGRFRSILGENGRGIEYWDDCRVVTLTVLAERLLKEESDWKLLIAKMKKNLFLNQKSAKFFLDLCPKTLVADLLFVGEGSLYNLVERIREEAEANLTSTYRISFIIDACGVVGPEAKELLTNCKHAVNRMNQMKFIPANHWLVKKVAAMKAVRDQHVPNVPEKEAPELVAA